MIRRKLVLEGRVQYSIVVCNETDAQAQALAFVPEGDARRTVAQSVIGPHATFSTTLVLDLTPENSTPVLRVAVSSGDTEFTLEVPAAVDSVASAESPFGEAPAQRSSELALATPRPVAPALPAIYVPPAKTFAPPYSNGSAGAARGAGPARRARSSPSILPALFFFGALLAAVGAFIGRPLIAEIDAPTAAAAGSGVTVSYRASGVGNAAFAVLGPEGRPIAAGALPLGAGSFEFTVPRSASAPAYLVRVAVTGPLGATVAERYVHVDIPAATPPPPPVRSAAPRPAPRPAPPAPQIRSLALDRATLASGEKLTIYYDIAAADGSIVLLDPATQIAYGKAALSPSGQTAFVAPRVDQSRFLTVVATAQRGGATTQSRISVTVTPPDPDAPAAPQVDGATLSPAGPSSSGTVITAPSSARSGRPIRVDISGATAGLEIVLLDESGTEVAHSDVLQGRHGANFTAPAVKVPTRFLFEATYPRGAGSETVVRAIEIVP